MINWTILLAVEEVAEKGGLFDINATLPLMAIQFLILAFVLDKIFYKPLGKAIDSRADYIRDNQIKAQEGLAKTKKLAEQYEQDLAETRKKSQAIITEAQATAQKIVAEKVAKAQQEAQAKREQAAQEIEEQKQAALQQLEEQVDSLSRQILEKLLGPELVR
ncbi:MAG: F0F1 ATP synthase subunit B' [Okeania sp. SIO2C2]|uniref:F0F1 ATP synthase subunit B' n=1 Tax=Okeania sp. SIO2C2 TaxID=2607787 RepID=UPI0013B973A5|nr:F0F1 ATP synthase subunit B' [Okeania sp. SIO2C2]NEP88404.1 F0F1 ATP synthase subunit B' [Okeania sp. SIO2C2]